MIANRNLYIVKSTNENKVLKIIDEIVDFKEKPKLGYNTYTVKSYKYGDIWFKIHYKIIIVLWKYMLMNVRKRMKS